MTAVDTVIQPGEQIPDDVTRVEDRAKDVWAAADDHWNLVVYKGDPVTDSCSGLPADLLSVQWGPLTVTAVREQPIDTPEESAAIVNANLRAMGAQGLESAAEPPACPAHGPHPHGEATCLDCPICRPPAAESEPVDEDGTR